MNKTKVVLTDEKAHSLPNVAEGAIASVKVTVLDVPPCDAMLVGVVVSNEVNPSLDALVCSNKTNTTYFKHLNGSDQDKSVEIEVPVLKEFENGIWFRGVAFFFSKENGVNVVYSSEYRHFCKEQ